MVGLYNRLAEEPIFREYLQELDDDQLGRVARQYVFLCETALHGPWDIDVWKRDAARDEFQRRHRSQLFEEAERFILDSLDKPPGGS